MKFTIVIVILCSLNGFASAGNSVVTKEKYPTGDLNFVLGGSTEGLLGSFGLALNLPSNRHVWKDYLNHRIAFNIYRSRTLGLVTLSNSYYNTDSYDLMYGLLARGRLFSASALIGIGYYESYGYLSWSENRYFYSGISVPLQLNFAIEGEFVGVGLSSIINIPADSYSLGLCVKLGQLR